MAKAVDIRERFGGAHGLWPLAALLGSCLYAVGFWVFAPTGSMPYQVAGELIERRFAPGDAVAVRPWWAARIREHVGDKPFVQVRDLAAEDLSHHARLWLLCLPDACERLGGPFSDGTYRLDQQHELDGLALRLYRLPEPAEVVYDFRQHLRRARVTIATAKGRKPCDRWVENRWVCSRREWNHVGQVIVELGDDPREVLWAHPTEEGPIEITYPQVPGGRELLVRTGLTPQAARTRDGAPVRLDVLVDGTTLASLVQPNQTGLFPHPIDISALGRGPHAVTFRVSSPRAGMRHFCFAAEVRR